MGEVWRGIDQRLRRPVAIKVLPPALGTSPTLVARFRREAELAASLQHPGITVVFDFDEHEERLFLVMELLDGEDLGRVIDRFPSGLPLDDLLSYGIQLAEALAAAHEMQVVHRDIKPGNLMVLKSGRLKVCDFGIARFVASSTGLTQGASIGTPLYMSPEQFEGVDIDQRADLYSLGCVLFELLTGCPPFLGGGPNGSMHVLIREHLMAAPPIPRSLRPDAPAELERLILALLAKSPAQRPADATTVAQVLRTLTASHAPRPSAQAGATSQAGGAHKAAATYPAGGAHKAGATYQAGGAPKAGGAYQAGSPHQPGAAHQTGGGYQVGGVHQDGATFAAGVASAPSAASAPGVAGWDEEADGRYVEDMVALAEAGRLAEAAAMAEARLARITAFFGQDAEAAQDNRMFLAWLLLEMGQAGPALVHAEEAVERLTRESGPESEPTLAARGLQAKILSAQGRYLEALPVARAVAEVVRRVRGPDHEDTVAVLETYGSVLGALSRWSEALPVAREVADAEERRYGRYDRRTIDSLTRVRDLLHALGLFADGLPVAQAVAEALHRTEGPGDLDTIEADSWVAAFLINLNRLADAAPIACHVSQRRSAILGDGHEHSMRSALVAGQVLNSLNRFAESIAYLERAANAYGALRRTHRDEAFSAWSELAVAYLYLGRGIEAFNIGQVMLNMHLAAYGHYDHRTEEARQFLAHLRSL